MAYWELAKGHEFLLQRPLKLIFPKPVALRLRLVGFCGFRNDLIRHIPPHLRHHTHTGRHLVKPGGAPGHHGDDVGKVDLAIARSFYWGYWVNPQISG